MNYINLKTFGKAGMNLAVLISCCFWGLTACNAQNTKGKTPEAKKTMSGISEPTIDKSIWCIYQDTKKNYWFGSNGGGVYLYDGKHLKQFTKKDGLQSDQIRGIQEDKFGNIYFETRTTVTKYDGAQFIALAPVESGMEGWRLQADDLWFRGNGEIDGVYRYDGKTLHHLVFTTFNPKWDATTYAVYSIYKDKKGNAWFGTLSEGVCRYDGNTLKWIKEKELSVLEDGRVPGVRYILEDGDGYFWLSNILSRYKLLPDKMSDHWTLAYAKTAGVTPEQERAKMTLPYCKSAIIDGRNLWMTNYNEGVWKYDGKQLVNYKIKDGTTEALVVCLYKDSDGILLVGTDNMGVYKYNGGGFEKFQR